MTIHRLPLTLVITMTLASRIAAAQHEGHQATQPMSGQDSGEMAQCARAAPVVDNIITAAMKRGESARQSNSPADMRAALDHLEAALRDIHVQLEPCKTAATSPASPAGHTMPGMEPSPGASAPMSQPPAGTSDPHAGHTMSEHQADMPMDPVTGAMVDPTTAPKTVYQGKTYYFSSEQSRKEFLANPAKYVKKD